MTEPSKAVFLSYASQDSDAAHRICEALRAAGVEVWFDQSELRGGEAWDATIRRQIKTCTLFVPLISHTTHSRDEGYFRLEWKLAVDRSCLMAANRPFLIPVVIDSTSDKDEGVPDQFRELQWTRLPNGETSPAFVQRIVQLLSPGAAAAIRSARPPPELPQRGPPTIKVRRALFKPVLIVLLLAVVGIGYLALRKTVLPTNQAAPTQSQAGAAAQTAEAEKSIAVLPLVDMSQEHDQGYFADGLTEELLNQLAQLKGLRVTGRTSSFSFKGKDEDLRVIGAKLGVKNLVEGSVRKAGDSLRITVQLIDADTGAHLWSQTYERGFANVLSVQDEVAKDVAEALSVKLDVGEMARANGGTNNVDAYDKYLRAEESLLNNDLQASAQFSRDAVALDPGFALGWRSLYRTLQWLSFSPDGNTAATRKERDQALARILALAPTAWWVLDLRGNALMAQRKWSEAEAVTRAALTAAPPSGVDAVSNFGGFLMQVGRYAEALEYVRRARQIDPLSLDISGTLQTVLDGVGRPAEAQAEYERSNGFAGANGQFIGSYRALMRVLVRKDVDPAAAKSAFVHFLNAFKTTAWFGVTSENFDDKARARASIRQAFAYVVANPSISGYINIAEIADVYGDKDLALDALRRAHVDLPSPNLVNLWAPFKTGLRADPRFKQIVRDLGLVDYWRAGGKWSDFCYPVGKDDFECR